MLPVGCLHARQEKGPSSHHRQPSLRMREPWALFFRDGTWYRSSSATPSFRQRQGDEVEGVSQGRLQLVRQPLALELFYHSSILLFACDPTLAKPKDYRNGTRA